MIRHFSLLANVAKHENVFTMIPPDFRDVLSQDEDTKNVPRSRLRAKTISYSCLSTMTVESICVQHVKATTSAKKKKGFFPSKPVCCNVS